MEILGDQEEAVQWNQLQITLANTEIESDQENEPQEEVVEVKKRRHRKASHVDPMEEKKKKLIDSHPLSVQIIMTVKDGPTLRVKFYHRHQLKIITATSTVDIPAKITGI